MPHQSRELTEAELIRLHTQANRRLKVQPTNEQRRRAALQDDAPRGETGQRVQPRISCRKPRPIRLGE